MTTEQTSAVTGTDPSTSDVELPDPDVDRDELKAAIAAGASEAAQAADLTAVRRAVGHIPGLQSKITALERQVAEIDSLKESNRTLNARFDALLDAVPEGFLPDRELSRLRPQAGDSSSEVMRKIDALEERLTTPRERQAQTPEDVDPETAAEIGRWQVATESVEVYAGRKGFDPATIPEAAWQRAHDANKDDPSMAAFEMMKYVDQQLEAAKRRAEKQDASAGGPEGSRTPRQGATTLTPTMMKSMSVEELRKYPKAEREAVLRAMSA